MKISILMPTYDCPPALLEKSLLSVLEQTHHDTEVIVKDGCLRNPATDHANIKAILYKHSSRVKYILSPDGPPPEKSGFYKHNGFYQALNECIAASTGEILSLQCADDERGTLGTLDYVNSLFEKHGPYPLLVYGRCIWIDKYDNVFDVKTPPAYITYEMLRQAYTLYTPALFWNRSVHDKFGVFDSVNCPWSADLDFWLKCWRCIDVQFSPRVLGHYRVWEVSQCRQNGPSMAPEFDMIMQRHP